MICHLITAPCPHLKQYLLVNLFQLQVFDSNRDGKLQLSEMSKYVVLLVVQTVNIVMALNGFFILGYCPSVRTSSADRFSRYSVLRVQSSLFDQTSNQIDSLTAAT